eukprot:CAMPEP_0178988700 /NCGR_PEP_ID=MMETSP0795-20121207/3949_1 /TAXON_ID=88552 /ORGANISM="Amoebophrya sp., Strain Ameob2" /LENGTH=740 /DNA_ID=CAMNT_0020679989 /DNA_START=240 /DNA_END=2462 /DNA_ORIENTATION=-
MKEDILRFYTEALGMSRQTAATFPNGQTIENLAFKGAPASSQLNFRFLPPHTASVGGGNKMAAAKGDVNFNKPLYWKIGLAVDDVNAALRNLGQNTYLGPRYSAGLSGDQFLDVGFLEHVRDPMGLSTIEFLQTTMLQSEATRKNRIASRKAEFETSRGMNKLSQAAANPVTGGLDPVIGQITTRTRDAGECVKFYTETLGMTLLEVEEVAPYNFDLYFFAYVPAGQLPKKSPDNVSNREWLYQLPVTTLEVQHFRGQAKNSARLAGGDDYTDASKPAFESISVGVTAAQFQAISKHKGFDPVMRAIRDPDGLLINLSLLPGSESMTSPGMSPKRSPRMSAFARADNFLPPARDDVSMMSPKLGAAAGANKVDAKYFTAGRDANDAGLKPGRKDWSTCVLRDFDPVSVIPRSPRASHAAGASSSTAGGGSSMLTTNAGQKMNLPRILLLQFPCLTDNYGYLLNVGDRVIAVDLPEGHGEEYCERAREQFGRPISDILITHWHWDHLGAWPAIKANNFAANKGVRPHMYGSRVELPNMQKYAEEKDFTELLRHGDHVKVGPLEFEVMMIPGHTLGHIVFNLPAYGIIFTGDVVFPMGCGRLFEGEAKECYRAIKRNLVDHLPRSTLIYPAHEYATDGCQFALQVVEDQKEREAVIARCKDIVAKRATKTPTVPFTLETELASSPFLRPAQFYKRLGTEKGEEVFQELRKVRNGFNVTRPWGKKDLEEALQAPGSPNKKPKI